MKKLLAFLFFIAISGTLFAQGGGGRPGGGNNRPALPVREVSGIVKDSTDNTIIGATIKLKIGADSMLTTTNADGVFVFKNVKSATFVISITSIGYKPVVKRMLNNDAVARLVLDPFVLGAQSNQLAAVEVKGPSIVYKTDTVEYRASDYKVRPNATVDELLKKMEGMEVGSDGSVTHQGQQVTKAKLNGKDYAGGDLARAIQTLGADIVEKIQVVDDYGDQAARTGIKDGDPQKVLNITTRADRSVGNTARINAGGGNNSRYESNVALTRTNGNKVLNIGGSFRNTVNGVASSGIAGGADGGRGQGGQGGNTGGSGGSGGTTTSGNPGITYRDQWGQKVEVNMNYRYTFNNINSLDNSYGQTYYQNRQNDGTTTSDTLIFNRNSQSQSNSKGHNFTFEMEYNIDSANFLRVTPSFSFNSSLSNSFSNNFDTGARFQDVTGRGINDNSTPNYGGIVFYQHIFKKPRRNASIQLSYTRSNQQQSRESDNNTLFKDADGTVTRDLNTHRLTSRDNLTRNFRTSVTYVEPLNLKSQLEFNAQINRRAYDNNAVIDSITPAGDRLMISPNLNNIFNYSFTETRVALNYRYNQTKYNLSFGATVVPTNLTGINVSRGGIETSRNNFFIIPIARFEYVWSRQHRASINYSGAPQEPTFNQIQPIVDSSNRSNPIVGNPNLKVAFRHTINARYNNYLANSRFTIGLNMYGTSIQNQITTNNVRIIDPLDPEKKAFINQTNYVNISGSYSIGGNYNISKQLADRKYNLALLGSVSYNHTLAMVNNLPTTSNGWTLKQRFGPRINPTEWIEVNPFVSYDYTKTFLIISDTKTTTIKRTALAIDGRFFLLKESSLVVGYDASKNFVSQQGYSSNPLVINAYVEKNFLAKRNLTFRLQVFDMLKQNNFTNQVINDNGFTNTLSNALSRYFMFSVRTNLQKWSGTPMRNGKPMRRRGDGSFF